MQTVAVYDVHGSHFEPVVGEQIEKFPRFGDELFRRSVGGLSKFPPDIIQTQFCDVRGLIR